MVSPKVTLDRGRVGEAGRDMTGMGRLPTPVGRPLTGMGSRPAEAGSHPVGVGGVATLGVGTGATRQREKNF